MSMCNTEYETFATVLTFVLTAGLCLAFIPQHVKIILAGQSFGFSPWFLLLGSTSSTAALLDIYMMQWNVIRCCRNVSTGICLMSLGGIFQISLQWTLFNITFILFILYYPSRMKFIDPAPASDANPNYSSEVPVLVRSKDWGYSILCAQLTVAHFILSLLYTVFLLATGATESSQQVVIWSTFLGVSSAVASLLQYLPQLWRTWQLGLVGALSIPLYCFEVPGAAVMVISIAMREGTNWTNWAMYAASGTMAGCLLFLCLAWKVRQKKLGVDDFGLPLKSAAGVHPFRAGSNSPPTSGTVSSTVADTTPLLSGHESN